MQSDLRVPQFLWSETTDFYADSVEWCHFPGLTEYLVCGTYQLIEHETGNWDNQTRDGSVSLYEISFDEDGDFTLNSKQVVHTGGVFDLKWCPRMLNDKPVLAVGCSNGKVILLLFSPHCSEPLSYHKSHDLASENKKMILSLDWSCESTESTSLITSDNLGSLSYINIRESELYTKEVWNAHSFEAWVATFDHSRPHIVYSGGDDCTLKGWDTRCVTTAIFENKRHSMGVTAISKCKNLEYILATGSYDENIYLWDVRSMKSPSSEISVNGGVWRLKWHPSKPEYLLSATMHNGVHVLSTKDSHLKEIAHYEKHKSLAYGVDWSSSSLQKPQTMSDDVSLESFKDTSIVASCSFYDKLMHLWRIKL